MSTFDLWLLIYPRERHYLRDQSFLTAFLEAIAQHGGLFTQHDANEELKRGAHEGTRTSHPTQGLLRELAAYCQHQQDAFTCRVYLTTPQRETFECSVLVDEEDLILSVTNSTLECSEEGTVYERWLAFVELVYQIWSPIFGYLSDGPEWEEQAIFGLKVNRLYELNLFGPEYVAQIGRERFQELKVWQQREMEDGGIIVAVGTYVYYQLPDLDIDVVAVASQLSLEAPNGMV